MINRTCYVYEFDHSTYQSTFERGENWLESLLWLYLEGGISSLYHNSHPINPMILPYQ
jgi:hypothetical protein